MSCDVPPPMVLLHVNTLLCNCEAYCAPKLMDTLMLKGQLYVNRSGLNSWFVLI